MTALTTCQIKDSFPLIIARLAPTKYTILTVNYEKSRYRYYAMTPPLDRSRATGPESEVVA